MLTLAVGDVHLQRVYALAQCRNVDADSMLCSQRPLDGIIPVAVDAIFVSGQSVIGQSCVALQEMPDERCSPSSIGVADTHLQCMNAGT